MVKNKIVFEPGCFDDFEGTQEELNEMVELITKAFNSGELPEGVEVIDVDPQTLSEEILNSFTRNRKTIH